MSTDPTQVCPDIDELKRKAARYVLMERAAFDDTVMEIISAHPTPCGPEEFRDTLDSVIRHLAGIERQAA